MADSGIGRAVSNQPRRSRRPTSPGGVCGGQAGRPVLQGYLITSAPTSVPSPAYSSFTLITLSPLNVTNVILPGGVPYTQSSVSNPSLVSRGLYFGRPNASSTWSRDIPTVTRFS